MLRLPRVREWMTVLASCALLGWGLPDLVSAQFRIPNSFGKSVGGFGSDSGGDPVSVEAQFTTAAADRPAVLMITAQIAPGWHVYALTQPPGGPLKAQIDVEQSDSFRLLGPFQPIPQYESHIDELVWVGLEIQEHEGEVTWYAPVEFSPGVDPRQLQIQGVLSGQACKESCIPIKIPFSATMGPGVTIGELAYYDDSPASPAADSELGGQTVRSQFQPEGSGVTISGRVFPGSVRPGQKATLELRLEPPQGWHIYAWQPQDDSKSSKPTLIAFQTQEAIDVGQPTTAAEVIEIDQSEIGWDNAQIHHGAVTWKIPLEVPAEAQEGIYPLVGMIGFQACEDGPPAEGSCEIPKAARFKATISVALQSRQENEAVAVEFAAAKYSQVADLARRTASASTGDLAATPNGTDSAEPIRGNADPPPGSTSGSGAAGTVYDLERVAVNQSSHNSLLRYLLLAFVGGIILNLMPCVLPVIGLKVMSFIDQAGHNRAQALALNCWYSAGIISVFLVLAGLAIGAGLSWGGQFSSTAFNATLAGLVFAMALSLLGVWEIPIPGFMGSGQAHEMAAKEGPLGAFLKGAITTVLATPCTGPFMASAVGWAVRQPPATTLSVFATLGLGMASPFLLVGAFPELIRFLPRPGNWMVTFKQIMGFVLLGTVVFLLSFMTPPAVVPTVAMLVGIGVACWTISKTPLTAEVRERLESWGLALAITILAAVAAFGWLYPQVTLPRFEGRLLADARRLNGTSGNLVTGEPWQPFSLSKLGEVAVKDGRTVLVDFSADWCLTCKTLEKTVLHTAPVEQAINDRDIVTMYGDFTNLPEELDKTIRALGGNGVPLIAIFPGDAPYQPIVFRDGYTKDGLLAAIEKATSATASRNSPPPAQLSATLQ